jgi:type I protein arginine methyltransferase
MASLPNGAAGGSSGAPAVDKEVDFANYFCTYGYLYHQKEMLCDRVRMDAYHSAVFRNAPHFSGKVRGEGGGGALSPLYTFLNPLKIQLSVEFGDPA